MTRYVGLLRAINVTGTNRISMEDLRAAFLFCGAEERSCLTYIQSGNVVFSLPKTIDDIYVFSHRLVDHLRTKHSVITSMVTRTLDELVELIDRCPFRVSGSGSSGGWTLKEGLESKFAHAILFHGDVSLPADFATRLEATGKVGKGEDVVVHPGERVVWCYYGGGGVAGSKVTIELCRKVASAAEAPTARNWNTLVALHRMMTAASAPDDMPRS